MLISPTEPDPVKTLGTVSSLPERYGADILILVKTSRVGIQRKAFPDDLLASLADGRLYDQVRKMARLNHAMLIIEGYGQWTTDGTLLHLRSFRRDQLHGLILSLSFEFGIQVVQTRDMHETTQLLTNLEKWTRKPAHVSLLTRPGPSKDSWGNKTRRLDGMHLLQSFDSIGPKTAANIYDHFKGVPLRWDLKGPEDFIEIPGIGKKTAQTLWEALA